MVIAVLVPTRHDTPTAPPSASPLGRAAAAAGREGLDVVLGGRVGSDGGLVGWRARGDRWIAASAHPDAVYDRYPCQSDPAGHARLREALGGLPWGNAPSSVALCRDKLESQRLLEGVVRFPPVEAAPEQFAARLEAWGAGFLKPRFGALGRGIVRCRAGDHAPAALPGAVPGTLDPAILQAAVPAPPGLAGVSVRVLVQRTPDGGWHVTPAAARSSTHDPVVNVARGASVVPAEDLLTASAMAELERMVRVGSARIAAACDEVVVELGWDAVIDDTGAPWIIEVNGRPLGRVEVLAALDPARFGAAHEAALVRPLWALAATNTRARTTSPTEAR
jgi:glutathione synthase/RimK-type ligase-like ATP-grasp enzyme